MSESSYSVDEFCKAERISRVKFYDLLKQGRGPKIMKIGTRTTISPEARREWHERMEREADAPFEAASNRARDIAATREAAKVSEREKDKRTKRAKAA